MCTVPDLYIYHSFGPYGLYRATVPVQVCTLIFTYTSTPSMGRKVCKEPQFLYKDAH